MKKLKCPKNASSFNLLHFKRPLEQYIIDEFLFKTFNFIFKKKLEIFKIIFMVYILMALIGFTVALIYFVAEAKIN